MWLIRRKSLLRIVAMLLLPIMMLHGGASAITSLDIQHIIDYTPSYGDNAAASPSACTGGGDTTSSSTLPGSDPQQKAFNFFVSKGLSDVQAAAIVGNLLAESSLNTSANQPSGPGMGIAQWSNPGRWNTLEKYAAQQGRNKFDLGLQLDFVWLELNGTPPASDYSGALKQLKAQTKVDQATGYFMGSGVYGTPLWQPTPDDQAARDFVAQHGKVVGYENPGTPHLNNRITAAQRLLNQLGGTGGGAVSGGNASCGSVGAVDCSSAAQNTASGGSSGASGGLSQVRQNVVCLTNAELALWKSGQMKAGHDFFKYSEGRDELWCADFASWIYWKAGYQFGSGSGWNIPMVVNIQQAGFNGTKFHWHARSGYTPKPGDLVIHLNGESHVNIVVSVNTNSSSMTLVGGDQHGSGGADGNVVNGYSESIDTTQDGITGYVSPD